MFLDSLSQKNKKIYDFKQIVYCINININLITRVFYPILK